ncbi:MAG: ATP-binding cassette domain-containing protein [Spirulinaceae cyanobacterium RM2_2_10]|nr:ATP-binding cassette domain-containing protein [Spirulinaceae cyanobacterium RM2_2_10]
MTQTPDRDRLTPLLKLNHVSLSDALGLETILHNISFTVTAGEFVAVVGASGAGKTSLLRLLNALSSPTTGEIEFAGCKLERLPVLTLRQQVVLVPQEPKLLGMTVANALAYPLRLQKLPKAECQTRLACWCDRLGIPDLWLERGELELSVGQRQLVAIARALVMQPRLLLLDEPTSALDVGTAERMLNALTQSVRTEGLTVLMVNHQLELAAVGDRALFLADGKLRHDQPQAQIDWQAWRAELLTTAQTETDAWE